MEDFSGRVAVITGAASGIGASLAYEASRRGMRLLLADVSEEELRQVVASCVELSAEDQVLMSRCDVTDYKQLEALKDKAWDCYGGVNLLFNNAGVLVDGLSWERSVEDWRWVIDVNLFGVVHGIKAFVPSMLASGMPGCVVNTASLAGILVGPSLGPYTASKHAVVGVSETLHYEFAQQPGCMLRAACLCPGEVRSGICDSRRIRPKRYGESPAISSEAEHQMRDYLRDGVSCGMNPDDLANFVFEGISSGRFWLLPHSEFKPSYEDRARRLIEETNPELALIQ